jgi:thiol-disulfide isomerase/thioredoxin
LKSNPTTGKVTISELYQIKSSIKAKQKSFKYSGTVLWKKGYSLRCFIGVWCHDTKREMPRLLKILSDAGVPEEKIEIYLLSKNKKQPEVEVKANKVFYTPTIIVLKDGKEVDRFVEHPYVSWVDDLNRVLNNKLD